MASNYDATEFVDTDFNPQKTAYNTMMEGFGSVSRAPTREEVDTRVIEAQQKLAQLKRAQEELERERASLEETRRRQMELHTGREEMVQHLTRGVGLLEESEFNARRDAEQMARVLGEFREALKKLESIHEESWTQENFSAELTRALTILENARMEWNAARLKLPVLSGEGAKLPAASTEKTGPPAHSLASHSFLQLCRIGLAFTWPLLLAFGGVIGLLIALLMTRHGGR
jgi:uncharacterized membrane protein YccC